MRGGPNQALSLKQGSAGANESNHFHDHFPRSRPTANLASKWEG